MSDVSLETPAASTPKRAARRKAPQQGAMRSRAGWFVKITMGVLCLLWVIPTFGLLVTSFRTTDAANSSGWWTAIASPFKATQWTLQNYGDVLFGSATVQTPMGTSFINSLAVALPATIIPIMIAAYAAYAFTFMEFKGRDVLFIVVVSLLVVPNQVALVPLLQFYGSVGLTGTFPAAWLAHTGFGMPLAIYILRNYMATLPKSVIESAKIDGASHFTTFWRLIVPMSFPALAAFAIFQFLWVWNDLLVALLFVGQGDNAVLTVNLAGLLGSQGQGAQLLTAGAFVTMAVPLLVFVTLQRYFIRGMTSGAVKG
jgi:alpha-glucoside transport system permease protein